MARGDVRALCLHRGSCFAVFWNHILVRSIPLVRDFTPGARSSYTVSGSRGSSAFGVELDLGGLAKGRTVDAAVATAVSMGLSGFVEAGGDIEGLRPVDYGVGRSIAIG